MDSEVQPSFYGGPNNYNECVWNEQEWAWNPIGAGDAYGNPSEVVSVHNDGTSITCSIIPMQWACDNVPCECMFNMTYTLRDAAVFASVTLINNRQDQTEYPAYDQELPAVYVNGFLYRLLTYRGDAPWTNQPLEEIETGFENNFWVPGSVSTTEHLAIMANADNFGVGIYNAGYGSTMLAGFFGEKGSGGTKDSATGYLAPIAQIALAWNEVFTYEYVLIMGNVNDIRNYVYGLHQGE